MQVSLVEPVAYQFELVTGKFHFKFLQILYVPHAWDGGHLFEKSSGTLLRSDLFHQHGEVEAMTNSEVVSRFKKALIEHQKGPFANYLPYRTNTARSAAKGRNQISKAKIECRTNNSEVRSVAKNNEPHVLKCDTSPNNARNKGNLSINCMDININ